MTVEDADEKAEGNLEKGVKNFCKFILEIPKEAVQLLGNKANKYFRQKPKSACECGLFGKDECVEFGIANSDNWNDYRAEMKDAGYDRLSPPSNINSEKVKKVKVALKCVEPPCPKKSFIVDIDDDFETKGRETFQYELPASASSARKLKFELSINGKTKIVKWKRKECDLSTGQHPPAGIIQVGGNLTVTNLANGLSKISVSGDGNTNIAGNVVQAGGRIVEGDTEGPEGVEGKLIEIYEVLLNLGVRSNGGLMSDVIELNTSIPTKKSRTYWTRDDQTSVLFAVYEGQSPLVKNNRLLTELTINGIPPGPRGKEDITLTMEIDDDGGLSITAQSVSTKKSVSKKISYFQLRASKQKAEKMILQAEENKVADDAERDRIQSWRKLQARAYELKWEMKDETKNPKIPTHRRKTVVGKCEEVIAWTWQNKDKEKSEYEQKLADLDSFYSFTSFIPIFTVQSKMISRFQKLFFSSFA